MKIPHNTTNWNIRATSVRLVARSTVSASTIFLGRAQAWVTNEDVSDAGAYGRGATLVSLTSVALTGKSRFPGAAPSDRGWTLERLSSDVIRLEADAHANTANFRVGAVSSGPASLTLAGDGTDSSRVFADNAWLESTLGVKTDVLRSRSGSSIEFQDNVGSPSGFELSADTIKTKVVRSLGLSGLGTSKVLFLDDNGSGVDVCRVEAYSFKATGFVETEVLTPGSGNELQVQSSGGSTGSQRFVAETIKAKIIRSLDSAGLGVSQLLFRDDGNNDLCETKSHSFTATSHFLGTLRTNLIETPDQDGTLVIQDSDGNLDAVVQAGQFEAINYFRSDQLNSRTGTAVDIRTSGGFTGATLNVTTVDCDTVNADDVYAADLVRSNVIESHGTLVRLLKSGGVTGGADVQAAILTLDTDVMGETPNPAPARWTLYKSTMVIAFGGVQTTSGTVSARGTNDVFGCDVDTSIVGTNGIKVNFRHSVLNLNYAPIAMSIQSSITARVTALGFSSFTIEFYNAVTNVDVNIAGTDVAAVFHVFGQQAPP
jgi:hypothetical protein